MSLVVVNNVYYADGGVNVDYYCYFVRAQGSTSGWGVAGGLSTAPAGGVESHH